MNRSRPSRYQFWRGTLISLKSVWFADQPRKQPIGQSNNQLRKQLGSRFMTEANRRLFLEMLAIGAGGLTALPSFAANNDGHTAGYDVSPASDYVPLIPRRSGDPVTFTASLDNRAIKATSRGWAREITTKTLPIATDIAGAHLFLNPGGVREMHWHNSAGALGRARRWLSQRSSQN
jgi:hypothetical protein